MTAKVHCAHKDVDVENTVSLTSLKAFDHAFASSRFDAVYGLVNFIVCSDIVSRA